MQATRNKTGNRTLETENSRGQVLTIDLILSLAVFIAAFYILYALWGVVQGTLLLYTNELEMSKIAIAISHSLALTGGSSSNWHATSLENASAFGLALSPNVLQQEKVLQFVALNASSYNSTKEKLGAGRHELYIFIDRLDGMRLYEFGIAPPDASRRHLIQSSQRFVILDNSIMILQVEVWSYPYT